MSEKTPKNGADEPQKMRARWDVQQVKDLMADQSNRNSKTYRDFVHQLGEEILALHEEGVVMRSIIDGLVESPPEQVLDLHCGLDRYPPHIKIVKAREFLAQAQAQGVDLGLVQELVQKS